MREKSLLLAVLLFCSGCSLDRILGGDDEDKKDDQPQTTVVSVGNDADLALVRKYNADANGGYIVRWEQGTVSVYDQVGVSNLQDILNEWNAVLIGKMTLVLGDASSPIVIQRDDTLSTGGLTRRTAQNHRIVSASILINVGAVAGPEAVTLVSKHELGHAVGFYGHTTAGGLMNAFLESIEITDEVKRTLRKLYELAPGTQLVP